MLSRLAALFALCLIAFAAMAASKTIAHDFLLSLQPEASEETYNQVIETLEQQGATSAF
jgi:methionine-rich copper-binding protein CopC